MNATILIAVDTPMFDTTEPHAAQAHVDQHGGAIYTWKTAGGQNWLEKGFSRTDTLALVVLPEGLGDTVHMPDDPPDNC